MQTDFDNVVEGVRVQLTSIIGLEGAELFVRYQKKLQIESTELLQETSRGEESLQLWLALHREGRQVEGRLESGDMPKIKKFVQDLEKTLPGGSRSEALPKISDLPQSFAEFVDDTFFRIPVSEKIQRVKNLATTLLKTENESRSLAKNCYYETFRKDWYWVMGSNVLCQERAWVELHVGLWVENQKHKYLIEDSLYSTHYYDMDWSGFAKGILSSASALVQAQPARVAIYPAVVHARVMLPILQFFFENISAEYVEQGRSVVGRDLGKVLFSAALNVVDDPTMSKTMGCRLWDGEGEATRRVDYVKAGKLLSFAHHRATARRFECASTASALRDDPVRRVQVGYHNLLIEPGAKDFVDLIRELPDGIFLFQVQEILGIDHANGELRLKCYGMEVSGGQEKQALSDVRVRIVLKEFFKNILHVGRDLKWGRRLAAPSLSVKSIEVEG